MTTMSRAVHELEERLGQLAPGLERRLAWGAGS